MDFNGYQAKAMRTAQDMNKRDAITQGVFGLCGEAGEVAELFKKSIFHGHELSKQDLIKELGDVLWYISYIANTMNINLDDIANQNIDKLLKRYPEGFSSSHSINRGE